MNLVLACLDDLGEPLDTFADECDRLTEIVLDWAVDCLDTNLLRLSLIPEERGNRLYPARGPRDGWDFHEVIYDPRDGLVHDAWHPTPLPIPDYLATAFPEQEVRFELVDRNTN